MKSMIKGALGALILVLALSGLTAASALASGPPIVETKPATAVVGTGATLKGKINPNGGVTKYYFEYGTTITYGSKTAEVTLKSETAEVEVSKIVEGLETKTGYHFRLVATNSYGTTHGADEVFTTPTSLPEYSGKFPNYPYVSFGHVGMPSHYLFECEGGAHELVVSGAKKMTGTLVLKGCEIKLNGWVKCNTPGAATGELVTEQLEAIPVYTSKAKKAVALEFIGLSKGTNAPFISSITCGGWFKPEAITGSVLGVLGAINTPLKSFTLQFSSTSETHEQSPSQFETEFGGMQEAQLRLGEYKLGLNASPNVSVPYTFEVKA